MKTAVGHSRSVIILAALIAVGLLIPIVFSVLEPRQWLLIEAPHLAALALIVFGLAGKRNFLPAATGLALPSSVAQALAGVLVTPLLAYALGWGGQERLYRAAQGILLLIPVSAAIFVAALIVARARAKGAFGLFAFCVAVATLCNLGSFSYAFQQKPYVPPKPEDDLDRLGLRAMLAVHEIAQCSILYRGKYPETGYPARMENLAEVPGCKAHRRDEIPRYTLSLQSSSSREDAGRDHFIVQADPERMQFPRFVWYFSDPTGIVYGPREADPESVYAVYGEGVGSLFGLRWGIDKYQISARARLLPALARPGARARVAP